MKITKTLLNHIHVTKQAMRISAQFLEKWGINIPWCCSCVRSLLDHFRWANEILERAVLIKYLFCGSQICVVSICRAYSGKNDINRNLTLTQEYARKFNANSSSTVCRSTEDMSCCSSKNTVNQPSAIYDFNQIWSTQSKLGFLLHPPWLQ